MLYRKDEIVSLCEGKSVLHLGFVQHSHQYKEMIKSGKWLHERINKVSNRLVGFDFLKDEVDYIKEAYNYEAYYADVTKLEDVEFDDKFDVIVCGELIEHLENPGLMLKGIKRFMHANSILIITTPNPWSTNRLKLIKKGIDESKWLNPEHTCWFSFQTLKQILERYNYLEVKYDYYVGEIIDDDKNVFKSSLLNSLKSTKNSFFRKKKVNYKGLFFIARLK